MIIEDIEIRIRSNMKILKIKEILEKDVKEIYRN